LSGIAEAQVLWSLHIMAMPDIEVLDQQHAEVSWMLWEVCNLAKKGMQATTRCLGGFYSASVRQDEDRLWKFDRVELNLTFNQPYPTT
ncbi:MAG: hypothetical protein ACN6NI_09705, partial [Acinetobacter sp.]